MRWRLGGGVARGWVWRRGAGGAELPVACEGVVGLTPASARGSVGLLPGRPAGRLDRVNTLWQLSAAAGWAYPLIIAVALLDGLFPVVPAETIIIAGGSLAAAGRLS